MNSNKVTNLVNSVNTNNSSMKKTNNLSTSNLANVNTTNKTNVNSSIFVVFIFVVELFTLILKKPANNTNTSASGNQDKSSSVKKGSGKK